jgi:hypothetical protein
MRQLQIRLASMLLLTVISSLAIYGQSEKSPKTPPTLKNVTESEKESKDKSENKGQATGSAEVEGGRNDDSLYEANQMPNRRIASREQVKQNESAVGGFLLAPFRAITPAINRRLTKFETERELNKLGVFLSNPFIHPTIGGLGEGSGFGAGVYVSTADNLSPNYKLFASGHATLSKYAELRGGIEIAPKKWANGKLQFNLSGRYLLRPAEDYFGSGPNSFRSDRVSYFRREQGARFEASWQALPRLKVGGFSDFSYNSITDGTDTGVARITEKFSSEDTPGLTRKVSLIDNGVFAEYEGRDEPNNPHAGTFARVTVSSTDGLGKESNFGSINYDIDARGYLPLGSKRRVLAVRFLGNFKDLKGEGAVPFFRLARLGDSETLRGYDSGRFRGLNAVHLNIEYRYKLIQRSETGGLGGIEAILFSDLGQVFNRKEELSIKNIKATWGGGLQFMSQKNVSFALLYAKSPEKGRIIFRFGKTF